MAIMNELSTVPSVEVANSSSISSLLEQIRPAWRKKRLIARVSNLIGVDPSSACQRLFNASIHDLREKIVIAGLDIAQEAAKMYKLPTVDKPEDITEHYPTAKIIDLAYRIGLLSRPDWRRLTRCYEIRRDLEHEDGDYEASVEDCVYIFQTCIGVVLSCDPIHLIRVVDIKDLIEQPEPATPAPSLLQDYEHAPQTRQEEIFKFLVSIALDESQADLVRQNAFSFLNHFADTTHNQVKLNLALHLQNKIGRNRPSTVMIRVAHASGALPYIKKVAVRDYFAQILVELRRVGYHWGSHANHGEILRSLQEVGGLRFCPEEERKGILKWMILAYIGEPGGRTSYGNIRHVFYSNSAAPLIEEIIVDVKDSIRNSFTEVAKSKDIARAIKNGHIQRRLDCLLDLLEA